jgi:hypothetical protein
MDLDALIKRTEAKLAAETDKKRRAELALDLATYAKTAAECDDDDDEDDDEDEDEKKSKKAASAKKSEEKRAEEKKAAAAKKPEEEAAEDEGEDAKAALAAVQEVTGLTGAAAIGALRGMVARLGSVEAITKNMQAEQTKTERAALVARAGRFVPPHILKATVENMKISGLRAYVAEIEKGEPIVATEERDLLLPGESAASAESSLPKDVRDMLATAAAAVPEAQREAFKAQAIEAAVREQRKSSNGAAGRY